MIDHLQWVALALSVVGAWHVGGDTARQRRLGFGLFLASNVCWAGWSINASAWAMALAQAAFTWTSLRGIVTNRTSPPEV